MSRGLLPSPSTDGMSSCRSLSGASFRSRAATLTDSSGPGANVDGHAVAAAADAPASLGLQQDSGAAKGEGAESSRGGEVVAEDTAAASREGLFPAAAAAASSSGRTADKRGYPDDRGRKSGANEDASRVPALLSSSPSRLGRRGGAGGSPRSKTSAARAATAADGGDSHPHCVELGGHARDVRGSVSGALKYQGVGGAPLDGRGTRSSGERVSSLLHAPPVGIVGGGCGGNIAGVAPRYHSAVPLSEHRLQSSTVEVKWQGQDVRGFVPTGSIKRAREIGKP